MFWKMEHMLQKSECSIFHNIYKYMIFQKRQKVLLWSEGLKTRVTGMIVCIYDQSIESLG